jgi:hypothetical protein
MTLSLEYLAGLVDGEGCIRLNPSGKGKYRRYYPRLQVTNTYLPILEQLKEQFGGCITEKKNNRPDWSTAYDWRVNGDTARTILTSLIPYLIIKKEKAVEVLSNDQKGD